MGINEVIVNGETIMSTREDTVNEQNLLKGESATDKAGNKVEGTLDPVDKEEFEELEQRVENLEDDTYKVSDNEGTIDDSDYIPFNDVSDETTPKKKTLFSAIVDKLKSTFLVKAWGHVSLVPQDEYLYIKDNLVDATKSDNDVTGNHYPSSDRVVDKNGKTITAFETVVQPSGTINAKLYAQNYDTSGNSVGQNAIVASIDKSGNMGYGVTDKDKFREAINTVDQQGTVIPDNSDLDTYTTAGTYYVASDASGATISHLPLAYCGKVLVFNNGNGGIEQFYFSNHSPRIYTRTKFGNDAWSNWLEITASGKAHSYEVGTEIPANADLNTYTTVGVYQCELTATAQTMSNLPFTGNDRNAFKLLVMAGRNASNLIQWFIPYNNTVLVDAGERISWRTTDNNGSSWNAWRQIGSKYEELNFDNAPELTSGDLNNYKTAGIFKWGGSNASNITRRPCDGACVMYVIQTFPSSYVRQIVYPRELKFFFTRNYDAYTSTWTPWARMDDIFMAELWSEANVLGAKNQFSWNLVDDIFVNNNNTGHETTTSHTITDGVVKVVNATTSDVHHKGIYVSSIRMNPMLSLFNGKSITLSCVVKMEGTSITNFRFGMDSGSSYYTVGTDYVYIERTLTLDTSLTNNNLIFYIPSTNAYTFYVKNIMVRLATIKDTSYAPYAKTNYQLTQEQVLKSDISPSTVGNGYAVGTVSGSAITATISGFQLRAGVIVAIYLSSGLSSSCTLNINSTGAKSVKAWVDADPSFGFPLYAGINLLMYDGTYYRLLSNQLSPYVFVQDYVADSSGYLGTQWGYKSNRAQLKFDIANGRPMFNYYKNGAWRGDKQLIENWWSSNLYFYKETTNSADGYVPIGVMMKDTENNKSITSDIIRVYKDHQASPYDIYGLNMVMQSGGHIIIGSGESAQALYGVLTDKTGENLYLVSDNNIFIESNGQTIANRKGFRLNNDGNLVPVVADLDTEGQGNIGLNNYPISSVYAKEGLREPRNNVDVKQANNGLTSTDDGWLVSSRDKNNISYAFISSLAYTDGKTCARWRLRNFDTSGTEVVNGGIDMYTDKSGNFWYWVKEPNSFLASLGTGYAYCSTAESTTAKVASKSNYALAVGGYVTVYFQYNVPANATLNINNQGAKAIYYRSNAITANVIKAGDKATFIYYDNKYHLLGTDRASTNRDSVVTSSNIVWNSNLTITGLNATGSLVNENLLIFSLQCTVSNAYTLPSYSVLFTINNMQLRNGTYNNELLNVKDTQQYWIYTDNTDNKLVVKTRTNIPFTANSAVRLHFTAYVNKV